MNSAFGLENNDLEIIISVLKRYQAVATASIFGSRAKGNFRNSSDVDIVLKGDSLNAEIVSGISYQLNEETTLPYKFDIINYHSLNNIQLKEHIDRVGICFYSA